MSIFTTGTGLPGVIDIVIRWYASSETNNQEGFSGGSSSQSVSVGSALLSIVNMVICMTAIYYAFKCGGSFFDVVSACCCSMCYLAYRLAIPCTP